MWADAVATESLRLLFSSSKNMLPVVSSAIIALIGVASAEHKNLSRDPTGNNVSIFAYTDSQSSRENRSCPAGQIRLDARPPLNDAANNSTAAQLTREIQLVCSRCNLSGLSRAMACSSYGTLGNSSLIWECGGDPPDGVSALESFSERCVFVDFSREPLCLEHGSCVLIFTSRSLDVDTPCISCVTIPVIAALAVISIIVSGVVIKRIASAVRELRLHYQMDYPAQINDTSEAPAVLSTGTEEPPSYESCTTKLPAENLCSQN